MLNRLLSHYDMKAAILDPGADIVVFDEGHLLNNPNSQKFKLATQFKTVRRVVLSGTPVQNNLIEYFNLIQLVKPHRTLPNGTIVLTLGTLKQFKDRVVDAIMTGQTKDCSGIAKRLMIGRAYVLSRLLDDCVHRAGFSILREKLEPLNEYTIYIKLSKEQVLLYKVSSELSPMLLFVKVLKTIITYSHSSIT